MYYEIQPQFGTLPGIGPYGISWLWILVHFWDFRERYNLGKRPARTDSWIMDGEAPVGVQIVRDANLGKKALDGTYYSRAKKLAYMREMGAEPEWEYEEITINLNARFRWYIHKQIKWYLANPDVRPYRADPVPDGLSLTAHTHRVLDREDVQALRGHRAESVEELPSILAEKTAIGRKVTLTKVEHDLWTPTATIRAEKR